MFIRLYKFKHSLKLIRTLLLYFGEVLSHRLNWTVLQDWHVARQ